VSVRSDGRSSDGQPPTHTPSNLRSSSVSQQNAAARAVNRSNTRGRFRLNIDFLLRGHCSLHTSVIEAVVGDSYTYFVVEVELRQVDKSAANLAAGNTGGKMMRKWCVQKRYSEFRQLYKQVRLALSYSHSLTRTLLLALSYSHSLTRTLLLE
jgi:hypothetical protein